MFSRKLGRSFLRAALRSPRRRRQLPQRGRGPCAAEVLETRLLLSATLSVDPTSSNPAVFHTIQAAVNAASPGSTIKVAPGTYNEDVTISKSLTLLGGQAISKGETGTSIVEYESTGFTVSSANKVTINAFTVEADPASTTSTGNAIFATNTTSSTFQSNIFIGSDVTFGPGVTHSEVANNSDPSNSSFSIIVNGDTPGADADDTLLENGLFNGGILLDVSATGALGQSNTAIGGTQIDNTASNVTVTRNLSEGADEGFIDTGNNNTYTGNTAENNGTGFSFTGGGKLTVTGNVATNNIDEGFFFEGTTTSLTMKGNTANNNGTAGFDLIGGSPNLSNDTANGNGSFGFEVLDGGPSSAVNSPTIIDCTANNSGTFGFELAINGKATVSGNTADGSVLGFGYSLAIAGGTVSNNTANNNNGFGFSIASTGPLSLSGNQADNNESTGIEVLMGTGTVSGNTANDNGGGFSITASGASILHNTAIGNIENPLNAFSGSGFVISGSGNSITYNTAHNNIGDGLTLNGVSHSTFSQNTSNNNAGDGIHLVGSGFNTLSGNTADNNGNDGFDLDANSTGNTLSYNTALGNTLFDLYDLSPGNGTDGTAGTANKWTHNTAKNRAPAGLQ
jgi:parallel beta-helix repeat protein